MKKKHSLFVWPLTSCLFAAAVLFSLETRTRNDKDIVLRIGTPKNVKSANIFLDSYLSIYAHLSNPPLMRVNEKGQIVGQVAKGIHVSSGYNQWTFFIHDDLYWSDGKKVTPEDIKFTIEYTKEKSPVAGWMKRTIEKVSLGEENSVILHLKQPYTRLDVEMATYRILPKHIWQKVHDPMRYTNRGPNIGCGPFTIEKIDLNLGVILFKRNPYWRGKKPKIKRVEIHLYQNKDILSLALEKGEIDIFYDYSASFPYPSLIKIRSEERFGFMENLNMGLIFLGWNLRKKPMSDPKFRMALSYAIDFEEVIKLDALGYGRVPNRGFIPPSMEHFKATPPLEYDLDKARSLLNQAGYRDNNGDGIREDLNGKNISLSLLIRPSQVRLAELTRDYFLATGVKINIKTVDRSTWISQKDNYRYDLVITRSTPWGMLMHANWATGYFDSRRSGEGVLHTVDDPKFIKLCDELLATRNEERLKDLSFKVQEYYADNLPAIPLYWNILVTPFNKRFTGFSWDPVYGIFNLTNFLEIEKSFK